VQQNVMLQAAQTMILHVGDHVASPGTFVQMALQMKMEAYGRVKACR
jgi:hypothetical protein